MTNTNIFESSLKINIKYTIYGFFISSDLDKGLNFPNLDILLDYLNSFIVVLLAI